MCKDDSATGAAADSGQGPAGGGNNQSAGAAGVITATRSDSFNSVNSDHVWTDKSRVVTLRASNPEV
jgi:hypothetical protein